MTPDTQGGRAGRIHAGSAPASHGAHAADRGARPAHVLAERVGEVFGCTPRIGFEVTGWPAMTIARGKVAAAAMMVALPSLTKTGAARQD